MIGEIDGCAAVKLLLMMGSSGYDYKGQSIIAVVGVSILFVLLRLQTKFCMMFNSVSKLFSTMVWACLRDGVKLNFCKKSFFSEIPVTLMYSTLNVPAITEFDCKVYN